MKTNKIIGVVLLILVAIVGVIALGELLNEYEIYKRVPTSVNPNVVYCDKGHGIIDETTCVTIDKKNCFIDEDKLIPLICETGWKTELTTTILKPKIIPKEVELLE